MSERQHTELAERFVEGDLPAAERMEFARSVSGDTTLAHEIAEQAAMDSLLRRQAGEPRPAPSWDAIARAIARDAGVRRRMFTFPVLRVAVAAAACLLIGLGVWIGIRHAARPVRWEFAESALATVASVKGGALVSGREGMRQLRPGTVVWAGSRFLTEHGWNSVCLALAGGAGDITLAEETDVTLTAAAEGGWIIRLAAGQVEVDARRKGLVYRVATTAGTAEALGTRFRVGLVDPSDLQASAGPPEAASNVMLVAVAEGRVVVANGLGSVTAGEGNVAWAAAGSAPRILSGDALRRRGAEALRSERERGRGDRRSSGDDSGGTRQPERRGGGETERRGESDYPAKRKEGADGRGREREGDDREKKGEPSPTLDRRSTDREEERARRYCQKFYERYEEAAQLNIQQPTRNIQ